MGVWNKMRFKKKMDNSWAPRKKIGYFRYKEKNIV